MDPMIYAIGFMMLMSLVCLVKILGEKQEGGDADLEDHDHGRFLFDDYKSGEHERYVGREALMRESMGRICPECGTETRGHICSKDYTPTVERYDIYY